MRYLTVSELIYINGTLLKKQDIATGKQQIRDVQLLDAAVARPAASAFGADAYPTLREKVAALLHSVALNHPFADGNKRTGVVSTVFMFRVNGEQIAWQQAEALEIMVQVAEGEMDVPELAAWFPLQAAAETFEPDAERDMALIAEIIHEQRWLLNELERR